jgi:hypothetical protein
MDYLEISELLEFLADLTIEGETYEICLSALQLQTRIQNYYFPTASIE